MIIRRHTQAAFRVLVASAATLAAGFEPAMAQTSAADTAAIDQTGTTRQTSGTDPDGQTAADIVVTGSRVIRDGSQAPTPVTVISAEQLKLASPGPIGEGLRQLPQFRATGGPASAGFSSATPQSNTLLNLRNLGAQRTLVLLDGRRLTPSTLLGATEINLLPQDLIRRVDIVTGGSSAAYGSDAVAGVVNFVLDTGFQGFRAEAQNGMSEYGDGFLFKGSATAGLHFAQDRGRIVLSGSYLDAKEIPSLASRPWGRELRGSIVDPATGQLVITTNVRAASSTEGGLIAASPAGTSGGANLLRGIQFLPGGATAPFRFGSPLTALNAVGGDGAAVFTNLRSGVNIKTVYGRVGFDVVPGIEVYAEGNWARNHNRYRQLPSFLNPGFNPLTIFSGNAFLPASVQATMTANGIPSFTLGRVNADLPPITADVLNRTWTAVGGVRGSLGGGWSLDAYYQHGETTQSISTENDPIHTRTYAAADAVRAPDGSIVCRVTLTNPGLYPGCVPLNVFGQGAPSQAAINYVLGTANYTARIEQDVAAASVRGEPFSTWAGPVAFGAGVEWRELSLNQTTDPISRQTNSTVGLRGFPVLFSLAPGGFLVTNGQPVSGRYNVKEGFAEVLVPLARDMAFARSLELNGAIRYADYSTSGGATTWKVGLVYEPFADLRLRGTRSRDIRAPNIGELFAGSTQGINVVRDPQNGNAQSIVVVNNVGNRDLQPEKADTLTAGIVYSPSFLRGFSASADYYRIDLNGVIASLGPQGTVDQCAAGSALACSNLTRNAAGGLIRILAPQLNLSATRVRGIDFEANYRTDVGAGDLAFRGVVAHLIKQETQAPGGVAIDRAGEVGGFFSANPKWSGTFNVNYTAQSGFGIFLQERFIGSGNFDNTLVEGRTIRDNSIPSVFYTDATVSYTVPIGDRKTFRWSLGVNNLFDREPPNAPIGTLGIFYPTNITLYDTIGRYFSTTVRIEL